MEREKKVRCPGGVYSVLRVLHKESCALVVSRRWLYCGQVSHQCTHRMGEGYMYSIASVSLALMVP